MYLDLKDAYRIKMLSNLSSSINKINYVLQHRYSTWDAAESNVTQAIAELQTALRAVIFFKNLEFAIKKQEEDNSPKGDGA